MELKDLKIGANFEIGIADEGKEVTKSYPVKLQNINADNTFEVDVPFLGGQMILFHVNALIEVVTTAHEGVFSFKARIISRSRRSNIPTMVIKPETEMEKKQRRAYFRLKTDCSVRYRKYKLPALGENDEPFKTTRAIDISGGGICIATEEKINSEDFFECVIILEKDVEIIAACKIVNIVKENAEDKFWKTSMKYERITEQAREKIINFVFQEQLKLRRKGLV